MKVYLVTRKDKNELIDYWVATSKDDWKAYETLKRGTRFVQALFFLHLSIEKR
jgi:hypothetical protein